MPRGTDANDLVGDFGIHHWRIYGLGSHRPPGYDDNSDFFITSFCIDPTWVRQFAFDVRTKRCFMRNESSGGGNAIWTDWEEIATSADLAGKVNTDNGYAAAGLDAATEAGTYTWLDSDGIFGMVGSLFNLTVTNAQFDGHQSITQELTTTYIPNTAVKTLKRSYYYANGWTPWVQQATATPPQEFDLPLAAGISGKIKYRKNQFGEVSISIRIWPNMPIDPGYIIATLPIGFRPVIGRSAVAYAISGGVGYAGTIDTNADGTIAYFLPPISGANDIAIANDQFSAS